MDYGMPTLIELKSLAENVSLCHELGLSFLELNMNLPEYQLDKLDLARLSQAADKYGIYYTIHLDENCNPCDFNKRISAAYTATVLETIAVAKRLQLPIINMHLAAGVYFTLPHQKVFLFEAYMAEYLSKLAAFRDSCTRAIGAAHIKICLENCGNFAGQAESFMRKSLNLLLESPAFGLTFDIGHNAAAAYTDEPIIMAKANRLAHFHIHDAKKMSNHLALGEGELDLLKYLRLAQQYNCRAVIETKTVDALRQSVAWLMQQGLMH